MKKYIFILSLSILSCNGLFKSQKEPDFPVNIYHLETIFELPSDSVNLQDLKLELGYFWDIYSEHIINLPEDDFYTQLTSLKNDLYYQDALKLLSSLYSDFSAHEQDFSKIMGRYASHFPNSIQPKIVTFFGAFNFPIVVTDSVLGIGLEMFLGTSSTYYYDLANKYPPYMCQNFQPDYMTALAINGWFESEYLTPSKSFLEQIVHLGKLKFIVEELTQSSESQVMGYTADQIKWCYDNEYSIWKFVIDQGLLYSNDQFTISKFTNPAPQTKGMPKESPGQVANWVGWQIVKKFMKNHPEISLSELLEIEDGQYILQESKYKPK